MQHAERGTNPTCEEYACRMWDSCLQHAERGIFKCKGVGTGAVGHVN